LDYSFSFYGATIPVVAGSVTLKQKKLCWAKSLTQAGEKSMEKSMEVTEVFRNAHNEKNRGKIVAYYSVEGEEVLVIIYNEKEWRFCFKKIVNHEVKISDIQEAYRQTTGWELWGRDGVKEATQPKEATNPPLSDEIDKIMKELCAPTTD